MRFVACIFAGAKKRNVDGELHASQFCIKNLISKSKKKFCVSGNSMALSTVSLPFKPCHKNAYSAYCSPYISYGTSREIFSKHQDILSLVIISFILLSWMFEEVVLMLREISFSSLIGLKGFRSTARRSLVRALKVQRSSSYVKSDYWLCCNIT